MTTFHTLVKEYASESDYESLSLVVKKFLRQALAHYYKETQPIVLRDIAVATIVRGEESMIEEITKYALGYELNHYNAMKAVYAAEIDERLEEMFVRATEFEMGLIDEQAFLNHIDLKVTEYKEDDWNES